MSEPCIQCGEILAYRRRDMMCDECRTVLRENSPFLEIDELGEAATEIERLQRENARLRITIRRNIEDAAVIAEALKETGWNGETDAPTAIRELAVLRRDTLK
jgi:hypothetical protein